MGSPLSKKNNEKGETVRLSPSKVEPNSTTTTFDSLSIPHEQRDLELIIDILDKNHDGVIDYEEFTTQIFEDPEQLLAELAAKKAAEKEAEIF